MKKNNKFLTEDDLKHINEILENFDFQKAHKIFECINCKWVGLSDEETGEDVTRIPNIQEIVSRSHKLLSEAIMFCREENSDEYMVSTGMLKATVYLDKNKDKIESLHLELIPEEWDTGE